MALTPACRAMRDGEAEAVAAFVRRVYDAFVAPTELPEGRATFARYADAAAMAARAADHRVWVAEDGGALVGALEVRDGSHVALLFVDGARQGRGVARALLAAAFGAPGGWPELTVNSTPNALDVYRRLGFAPTAPLTEQHGLRFVPMRRPSDGGDGKPAA